MNFDLFVQARISSTRLLKKALLEIKGKPMLYHVLYRLKHALGIRNYVLLCDEESKVFFEDIASECGFLLFVGPKEDVLSRFAMAAKEYKSDFIIRATGDNPLVFFELINGILPIAESEKYDYLTYKNWPYGAGFEIISTPALFYAEKNATLFRHREHVCPYLYENEHVFKIGFLNAPKSFVGDFRITVDTLEDFEEVSDIYSKIYDGKLVKSLDLMKLRGMY